MTACEEFVAKMDLWMIELRDPESEASKKFDAMTKRLKELLEPITCQASSGTATNS